MDCHVVILAAGQGTRMKSALPKVLHRVGGVPLIEYVLAGAAALRPRSIVMVVGHHADALRAALRHRHEVTFVVQQPQLGTAHALLQTESALRDSSGVLVLLSGDVPLLTAGTLKNLVDRHAGRGASATVVTAVVDDPGGYGRIVRSGEQIARIVEEKDATSAERQIREINSGIYAFALDGLFDAVRSIAAENSQKEYYLPDLVSIYRRQGRVVETVTVSNADEVRGINSRGELAAVSRIVREQKNAELMAAGVTIVDPSTAYIDRDVTVGVDTVIHPCVFLEGRTTIGAGCEIHSGARIVDSQIGDGVVVLNHSVINGSRVADGASVGPFAHLRSEVDVGEKARVGNFVEMKKTVLGAGTITCNYDGVSKNKTTIEDGAFIGSDSQLIAPVTIGKGAYVGSGATIRENVPDGALAVSAGKQRTFEHWVADRKKKDRRD
jgi:bifunctional UDP-N-acetylglucosamine pyrophosphorylase/glucosamine-1-phosphate N-acetyltransferase